LDADVGAACLTKANLTKAWFDRANISGADLTGAILKKTRLQGAILTGCSLRGARLSKSSLFGCELTDADLSGAELDRVDLRRARMSNTRLRGANISGALVYSVSAWRLDLQDTKQEELVITDQGEPEITIDDLEIAQFLYLLLNNRKVRNVIDTIASRVVLILGRFTPQRKRVL